MDTSKPIPNLEVVQELLIRISAYYPEKIDAFHLLYGWKHRDKDYIYKNLSYLDEIGLIEMSRYSVLGSSKFNDIKITAKGLDYLHPNGGLSPLTAPFIRIAPDNLRNIACEAIQLRQDISSDDKGRLSRAIAVASDQTLRELATFLFKKGIESMPQLIETISRIMSSY